ncbi:hypothetical protein QE385_003936 [Sphingomonas sp. SORGH_AS 950]|uniref:hypothetical protein n=1 Tax=Sphingomonas sp. SORGH_AS_0950 TaxID=3041792 RepID=UPI002781CDA8|nr:hypothetical protein [Sphingomonas sp. SORGH_AS_0950]MDQ1159539.1 hypothetical protein [Sphingomonas sp. SORGH_AS_0950]
MKRVAINNLLSSAANVALFADKLARFIDEIGPQGVAQLNPQDLFRTYLMSLRFLTDTAERLGLPATLAATSRCKGGFDRLLACNGIIDRRLANEIVTNSHQLYVSLSDELEKHHAYIVSPREGDLIDNGIGLFGLEVVSAMPEIRKDVADAARCRAYELWTASVMHMMRVAEVGVAALADHLGIVKGSSWGITIANVLEALDKERAAKGNPELKQWASETATYLAFVKDAFRNPAMHPEMSFTAEQAVSIYDNTRAFMRKLATRLPPPAR